jgi:hypothetical protein
MDKIHDRLRSEELSHDISEDFEQKHKRGDRVSITGDDDPKATFIIGGILHDD